jgi:hypothetical protein
LITVGIICLVVAALFWGNPILWTIGVILVVVGVIFWILARSVAPWAVGATTTAV